MTIDNPNAPVENIECVDGRFYYEYGFYIKDVNDLHVYFGVNKLRKLVAGLDYAHVFTDANNHSIELLSNTCAEMTTEHRLEFVRRTTFEQNVNYEDRVHSNVLGGQLDEISLAVADNRRDIDVSLSAAEIKYLKAKAEEAAIKAVAHAKLAEDHKVEADRLMLLCKYSKEQAHNFSAKAMLAETNASESAIASKKSEIAAINAQNSAAQHRIASLNTLVANNIISQQIDASRQGLHEMLGRIHWLRTFALSIKGEL